jgi:hypothetical protein
MSFSPNVLDELESSPTPIEAPLHNFLALTAIEDHNMDQTWCFS